MKFETFKSGQWIQQYEYKSFQPTLINQEWSWENTQINTLLENASRSLAELDAFTLIVPDVDLFIHLHITKEANKSSRIEGTKTEMDEALMEAQYIDPEKRDDWAEVQNYVKAINQAITELKDLPLSNRLLKQTHAILMQGVRGENKTPGEYRRSQNWIGGSNINNAVFIPPHQNSVDDLMSDLELFWHNTDIHVPELIRIALSHYQFETIHPFLDGNGRIGRLLITLFLVGRGLLRKPSLYLSDFFERNRGSYYDALTRVRESNDIIHWITFFLSAVIETANKGKNTFESILQLKQEVDTLLLKYGRRAKNADKVMKHLYQEPFITIKGVSHLLGVTHQSASSLVKQLMADGILTGVTKLKRNQVYGFERYVRLFMD